MCSMRTQLSYFFGELRAVELRQSGATQKLDEHVAGPFSCLTTGRRFRPIEGRSRELKEKEANLLTVYLGE